MKIQLNNNTTTNSNIKRDYDIKYSLITTLEQYFLNEPKQYIIHIASQKKFKFEDIKVYNSLDNPIKNGKNLPDIVIGFRHPKNGYNTISLIDCLKKYSGFTQDQERLINVIKNQMEEQNEVFLEENKNINAKNDALDAQHKKEEEARKRAIEEKEKQDRISKTRFIVDSDDGHKVTRDEWMELYDKAQSQFTRDKYEHRAVTFGGAIFCNAARALIAYGMNPKAGDQLYAACERGHYYNGHPVEYTDPDTLLIFINEYYPVDNDKVG